MRIISFSNALLIAIIKNKFKRERSSEGAGGVIVR